MEQKDSTWVKANYYEELKCFHLLLQYWSQTELMSNNLNSNISSLYFSYIIISSEISKPPFNTCNVFQNSFFKTSNFSFTYSWLFFTKIRIHTIFKTTKTSTKWFYDSKSRVYLHAVLLTVCQCTTVLASSFTVSSCHSMLNNKKRQCCTNLWQDSYICSQRPIHFFNRTKVCTIYPSSEHVFWLLSNTALCLIKSDLPAELEFPTPVSLKNMLPEIISSWNQPKSLFYDKNIFLHTSLTPRLYHSPEVLYFFCFSGCGLWCFSVGLLEGSMYHGTEDMYWGIWGLISLEKMCNKYMA